MGHALERFAACHASVHALRAERVSMPGVPKSVIKSLSKTGTDFLPELKAIVPRTEACKTEGQVVFFMIFFIFFSVALLLRCFDRSKIHRV